MKKGPRGRQALNSVQVYVPGTPGDKRLAKMVRLASNESSWGPSKKAVSAFHATALDLHRYPVGGAPKLTKALAKKYRVAPGQIIVGLGSNEILMLLAQAVLDVRATAVIANLTFPIYKSVIQVCGARPITVPMRGPRYDLAAMVKAAKSTTRLIFVANPNNPTGTAVGKKDILLALRDMPTGCALVLDEAYAEYTAPNYSAGPGLLASGHPVAVLRTFSKIYALASLRVGYGIFHPDLASSIEKVRQPFNVSAAAEAAALAAFGDKQHIQKVRKETLIQRGLLEAGLSKMGFAPVPSQANFIFVPMRKAGEVFRGLLRKNILVRLIGNMGLRITVGRPSENKRFLRAIKSIKVRQG